MKVSFVIPTLNRVNELERLLQSFLYQTQKPDEIIIVEQGDEHLSTIGLKHHNTLPIHIYNVDFESLTKARNFGVEKSSGDIIGFLDDDIVLTKNYVENIKRFFSSHPGTLGVQGVITNFRQGHTKKVGGNPFVYSLYNVFAKFFLLNNSSDKNRLLWSGRNQYASKVNKIMNCEWLSGIGNYHRRVFDEFTFDEFLDGYALGEDKLFSYPISEKYQKSLCVDPEIQCEHHHAPLGRPQDKKWVEMKIYYTYYLWSKLFKKRGFFAYLAFFWASVGDLFIVFFSVILFQNTFKFLWWHIICYAKLLFGKHI
ncbi:MAG TPA: hypothetical protein DCS29_00980 [Candidatus Magasanikbacteria bacterium]|nr:MAG: hypothetical protein A2479_04605 [Candidatus Magasanikbacteria bacterium RIFOXYC2_FULL_39_8]HAT03337.1 hypothetical protein [Candidatus Magasanikbacteria bacterium]